MAEKVTEMKLKVDLQCPCCYKKVKKILSKFPQIRDQVYDEKKNIVKIIVVCCNPEKFRDRLCCKGAQVIQSIEIVEPPPPKPKPPAPPQKVVSSPPPASEPVQVFVPALPKGFCCLQCYEGYPGGPCYEGYRYGRPVPTPPCYDPYGYPCRCGYNRCYVNHCDEYYFSDESPPACLIM